MSRFRTLAVLALSSTLLVACGSDSDSSDSDSDSKSDSSNSDTPQNDSEAAAGETIEGEGYSFSAPEGWEPKEPSELGLPAQILHFVAEAEPDDNFADNINLLEQAQIAQLDIGQRVEAAQTGLKALATGDIVEEDTVTLDGEEAAVVSTEAEQQGATYAVVQYYVSHDDNGYVITFSYSPDVPKEEQLATAESVAASWKWAS